MTTTTPDYATTRRPIQWGSLIRTAAPAVALVILVVVTALVERVQSGTSTFLSPANILNVLRGQAPVGIVAVGMTLVIIGGGIDLSVGSMVAMAACAGAVTMNAVDGGFGMALGLVVMLAVGLASGAFNGVLTSLGRIPPFIATLGGYAAYRSVAQTLYNGTLQIPRHKFASLYGSGIPIPGVKIKDATAVLHWPTVFFFCTAAVVAVVLNKTRFGRHVVAVGGNERAAIYSAVPVKWVKWLTYVIAGLCCGLAAILDTAKLNSVPTSDMGGQFELDAIAAVVVGGTLIAGGTGTVIGTVIGVLILGTIENMLIFLNVDYTLRGLIKGGIIIAAALIQQVGRK